jgi:surface antigen
MRKKTAPLFLILAAIAAIAWSAQLRPPTYHSKQYGITFSYPRGWAVKESAGWREPMTPTLWQAQIAVTPPQNAAEHPSSFAVNIWAPRPENLEAWIFENLPVRPHEVDLELSRYVIGGYAAYAFEVSEGSTGKATMIVFQSNDFVYQIAIPATKSSSDQALNIARSILIETDSKPANLKSVLPIRPRSTFPPTAPVGTLKAASCTGCPGETDSFTNSYPCCDTFGNCTWKCEQMRSGADNFFFTGSGRDAYKWMDLEYSTAGQSYAQGGNIPAAGAVIVMIQGYCASCQLGHVATVQSVGSDGSVTVVEQNCGATCGRTNTFSTTTLRTYLAGYIYNSSSTPNPAAKAVSSTIGAETIIDDYNFSDVYNFLAKGPGTQESFNGGYRAWFTSSTGAYNSWMHATKTSVSHVNMGRWQSSIGTAGVYEVQAYIPNSNFAVATAARYRVDGVQSSPVDQSTVSGWVKIVNPNRADGNWSLGSGSRAVELYDNESGTAGKWLGLDALKFIRRG